MQKGRPKRPGLATGWKRFIRRTARPGVSPPAGRRRQAGEAGGHQDPRSGQAFPSARESSWKSRPTMIVSPRSVVGAPIASALGQQRRRAMSLDPLVLSRIQFAWVIAWHFLLPAFTVGLASFIAVLEGLNLFTGREIYLRISSFWIKIFAVSFGMGVVSGIVMPFQIGTNWSRYSDAAADVVGPLLAYEGLVAFFLEAAFLGVLLFGRKLVPPWAHFVAALMVAFGTLFSTFWILSTNSWMQTPAGYAIVDGRFVPKDWLQIIFSPSFPYRLAHVVDAVYITTGFVVVGVAASYLRQRRFVEEARTMLSMTLWLLSVLVPLQFLLGDAHGLNTLEHQPAKLAAIEAIWNTHSDVELNLFAIPDEKAETDRYAIAIPELGSLILTHDLHGTVHGLKDWPANERPSPIIVPFFGFRIMVGIAVIMLAMVVTSLWLRWRGELFHTDWFLWCCTLASPLGFVAVLAGWATTEVGRQPWTVYGLLRTADSVSPSLTGFDVAVSLAGYCVVYLVMFPAGLALMIRIIRLGPAEESTEPEPIESGRPAQPVQALPSTETGRRR
jgi:cytochrome d ubiquinol oxidase subunit I